MNKLKTAVSLLLYLLLSVSCNDLFLEDPTNRISAETIDDQITSIDQAVINLESDENAIRDKVEWVLGDLRGKTRVWFKNNRLVMLEESASSSFGSSIQKYFLSETNLIYAYEYRVTNNCNRKSSICISESKHYYYQDQLLSAIERKTVVPNIHLHRYDSPFFDDAIASVPFEVFSQNERSLYQSDMEKYQQLKNKWESISN
ncbi:hypothetical protein [Xanthovirga aplysinae]|uniref:hypothetical protein n=1 Tax=Xanthovirga aplysinae TaxID=2529853 RepID=UPI0012BBDFB4|nr:hypothetical protein [Xanthovirga aplysinae]MTI29630.1 hypothetical protein [Xanthovirga aplysinae]